MDKKKCSSCGEAPHKCSCKNKEFTKAVIEIDNPEQITLMRRVVIPASMGDDTTVPPTIGKYHNVLLYYEANSKSYLYSSDGIPTQLVNGFTNYEEAINLPQINGVTLLGDKSAADLELADAPMVITVASGNTSWSGADTAEDVYDFFLNKGKVNVVFSGGENYAYEIASAGYIENEGKLLCVVVAASTQNTGSMTDFDGNALFGTMALYTAGKAVDVGQIELQPKLYIADFTGLDLNYNELSGVPATNASIGMVKPGDGLEVASDGTLSISDIKQYAHFFDTVADMKAATNLVTGDYARTLGYYAKDDMGGAYYKVSSTAPSGYYETLNSGLYAELVPQDTMDVRQFGAKGDGVSDDTTPVQIALTACDGKTLIIPDGTYSVDTQMELPDNINIKCNGKITYSADIIYLFAHSTETDGKIEIDGIDIEKLDNSFDNLNRFIYVRQAELKITNSKFKNYKTAIHAHFCKHLYVDNCYFENANGIAAQYGYGIDTSANDDVITNVTFKNTDNTNGRHAIYLNGNSKINSFISNISVTNWHHNPIQIAISNSNTNYVKVINANFVNCLVEATGDDPLSIIGVINISSTSTNTLANFENITINGTLRSAVANLSTTSRVKINNLYAKFNTSDVNTNYHGIYLRYNKHEVYNVFLDYNDTSNLQKGLYFRGCDAIANGVYTNTGLTGDLVYLNTVNLQIGLYTPASVNGTGTNTVTALASYSA